MERAASLRLVSFGYFCARGEDTGVYVLDVAALKQSVRTYELTNHLGNVLSTITDKGVITSAQDYFPFGLTLASRSFTEGGSVYRFGFNGKENDNELKQQNYGLRIYRPDLGRFPTVDPLTKKYPFYSPYQFAGNMPIKYIDLDGAEPAKNPTDYSGTAERGGMEVISHISGTAAQLNGEKNRATPLEKQKLLGSAELTGTNDYVTDTNEKSAEKFNLRVSNSSTYKVDESNSKDFQDYEAFVVKTLMTNFQSGLGPENYDFPTNGIISSQFLNSDIVKAALIKHREIGYVKDEQFSFGFVDLIKDTWRNGTVFNITGLTGSGLITITPTQDGIAVKIFNITSLTSGSLGKEVFPESKYPRSYVRDPAVAPALQYANISQTYNLMLSPALVDKIIGQ